MSERVVAPALLADFASEAHERIGRIEELLLRLPEAPAAAFDGFVEQILRDLHTLKGNSALVGLASLQALAHGMEDLAAALTQPGRPTRLDLGPLLLAVDRFRAGLRAAEAAGGDPAEEAAGAEAEIAGGVRVSFAAIDGLVELLAEMVMFRQRLADGLLRARGAAAAWEQVDEAHRRLGGVLDQLQEGVLGLRMMPLRTLFGQLHRLVHDEGERQAKHVRLTTEGGDTPLDKGLLELASEALGHLVRNAVTHGIETPAERRAAGKAERGHVRLSATATGREVHIDVEDDGRGLRRDEIVAAAQRLASAPLAPLAPMVAGEPEDAAQLIFVSGLSTRREADWSAGRGIGLAAVRAAVERRGGRIEVVSHEGVGSRFRLSLPLTASIIKVLMLRCDGERYALPLRAVLEGMRYQAGEMPEPAADALYWRGGELAALDLGCGFGTASRRRAAGYAVIIEEGDRRRALLVDEIQEAREIVVKTLDPLLGPAAGLAGSTVLGDGRAVLILDPQALLDLSPRAGAAA